jgi:hypothetical protein
MSSKVEYVGVSRAPDDPFLAEYVRDIFERIPELPGRIVDRVRSVAGDVIGDIVSGIAGLIHTITGFVLDKIVDIGVTIFNMFISRVNEVVPKIIGSMQSLIDQMASNFDRVSEALVGGFRSSFDWTRTEFEKVLGDVARLALPWLPVGETKFATASAKALITYWIMKRYEKLVSGELGFFGTIRELLLLPFYLNIANWLVPVISGTVTGISMAPAVRLPSVPSEPPVSVYEVPVARIEHITVTELPGRGNVFVGSVVSGVLAVFGGWVS